MLLQVIVNKMKKFIFNQVLLGLVAGMVIGLGLIAVNLEVAHGEEQGSFFNRLVASGDSFEWADVFARDVPQDLYLAIYEKMMTGAEDEAKVLVAKNSGYTADELEAILNGSLVPVFNDPNGSLTMTNEEALGIVKEIQDNYEDVLDLLDTSREVEALIKPSEIFSNGSLEDSGFDLVRDLELIEAVLFVETQPVTVGKDYLNRLDDPADIAASAVPNAKDVAVTGEALTAEEERVAENFSVEVGAAEISGRLLVGDVCEPRDGLGRALDKERDKDIRGERDDGGAIGGGELEEDEGPALGNAQSGLEAAPADKWGEAWCPGFSDFDGTYDNFSAGNIGGFFKGFASLGGSSPAPLLAAAGESYEDEYVKLDASVCLTISMVRQTYQSYYPGQTCVLCEVRKINQYLDQTLNHSLIPNKATGNLLESAKCKEAGSLFNLQFIAMLQPVMQPPNDNLIFGNDIFEEWTKFAKRYEPLLVGQIQFKPNNGPDLTAAGLAKSLQVKSGESQLDALNRVREARAFYEAEALKETGSLPTSEAVANEGFYDQTILSNMREMNELFNSLKNIFNNINNGVLREIKAKPDLG